MLSCSHVKPLQHGSSAAATPPGQHPLRNQRRMPILRLQQPQGQTVV